MSSTRAFPCALASLKGVRTFVTSFCRKNDIGEMVVAEIELAVNEACTNIVLHSGLTASDTFTLSLDKNGKTLAITLMDSGQRYDFQQAATIKNRRDLKIQRPRSGMGVYIIRQLIDAVMYNYLPEKRNELKLLKNL